MVVVAKPATLLGSTLLPETGQSFLKGARVPLQLPPTLEELPDRNTSPLPRLGAKALTVPAHTASVAKHFAIMIELEGPREEEEKKCIQ